jgi:hypothetical protein
VLRLRNATAIQYIKYFFKLKVLLVGGWFWWVVGGRFFGLRKVFFINRYSVFCMVYMTNFGDEGK